MSKHFFSFKLSGYDEVLRENIVGWVKVKEREVAREGEGVTLVCR